MGKGACIEIYTNIEAERVRKQMSKEQIAQFLDISSKTYANYVNCNTPIPSNVLLKLSEFFMCSTDYLLNNDNTPSNGRRNPHDPE